MFSYNDKSMPAVAGIVLMRLNIWIILAAALLALLVITRYVSCRLSVPIIRPRRSATGELGAGHSQLQVG
jgi:hypothetical protein